MTDVAMRGAAAVNFDTVLLPRPFTLIAAGQCAPAGLAPRLRFQSRFDFIAPGGSL